MTVTINGTTGVSGVAGSASTPALIGSDADSGYYINSANEPNASVNGTAVWSAASTFGFKNRIINGAMVIDQRNAGASVTPATGAYTLDRWCIFATQASKFTIQQNAGSVTPPAGYTNYLGLTVGASANVTVGAGDYFLIDQVIEGFNLADLNWGSASAASVTLSFWVRSSLTGTFGGAIKSYSGAAYGYPFSYTINSANTWEQKTITISGPTSTWAASTTNGGSAEVIFSVGTGSTYTGSAGSWQAASRFSATGSTNLISTNSATFYITGVQLEKGSTATSFDYRPYGTELALCQRYFFAITGDGTTNMVGTAVAISGTQSYICFPLPVQMRTYPTMTQSLCVVSDLNTYDCAISAINNDQSTLNTGGALVTTASGTVTYRPQMLYIANASAYMRLSAEL